MPEGLAVTILINSRVAGTAFKAVQDHGHKVALETLPSRALEETDEGQRQAVCDVICTVVAWPGFAASVATKVLHKKRPALIPILDNEAIFGAYMSPTWPERRASMDSVYSPSRIREALDWIWFDLTRAENVGVWPALCRSHPSRTRIELFDMGLVDALPLSPAGGSADLTTMKLDGVVDGVWAAHRTAIASGIGAVVLPSVPIAWFGDLEAYLDSPLRVITVGLNPSRLEFPSPDPFFRFPRRESSPEMRSMPRGGRHTQAP